MVWYKPTSATSGTIIDSFEDGDLAEYTLKDSDASDGEITIQTQQSTVYEGSYALGMSGDTENGTATVVPSDLSGATFDRGETATVRIYLDDPPEASGAFHYLCTGNYYDIFPVGYRSQLVSRGNDIFRLQRIDSSSITTLASTSVDWSAYADEWLEIKVTESGGTITTTAFDSSGNQLGQVSATDTTYDDDGFGFSTGLSTTGGATYYDFAVEE